MGQHAAARDVKSKRPPPLNGYALHLEAAAADRDASMAQVEANADESWKAYAEDWMIHYLKRHPTMFTDELWDLGLEEPREMRALGPLVLGLARQGYIVKTGETRPRANGHCAHGPVWRSLIYRPPTKSKKPPSRLE
jgi:hypothetical protein